MAVIRRANNDKISQQRWGGSNWRTIGAVLGAAGLGGGIGYLLMKHPEKACVCVCVCVCVSVWYTPQHVRLSAGNCRTCAWCWLISL